MRLRSSVIPIAASVVILLSSITALAQSSTARARVTEAVDVHNRVTLPGNVHPLARSEFDKGAAPDNLPMRRILLVLQRAPEQESALRQMLDAQQDKASPSFHQWVTPEQFGQQFGPADSDIQAVTNWLAKQGFEVTKVGAGRTVIEFSGTAGQVRQALGTEIHKYHVNGEDHWANAGNPQIPAALAPVVAGLASLNNFPRKPLARNLGTFRRSQITGKVEPLFTYPATCTGGGSGCYYVALGPTDFATIYNLTPVWDGTGQTIAVVGETNINIQDVRDFRSMFGLTANDPNIILNGPDPGIVSDETEADLDVQWSGAVAKNATVDFVVSESTEATLGIDLSALYIIDNNLAPVLSESYGACELALGTAGNQFYATIWEQAAAQGITVLLGSGDSGSAGCDSSYYEIAAQYGLAVSGMASTPFNVAVGGTDFAITSNNAATYWNQNNTSGTNASAKSYIPETTWNYSCAADGSVSGCTPPPDTTMLDYGAYLVAAGGGKSAVYSKPTWQSGTNAPSDGVRDLPDISLFSGGTSFYVVCQIDANAAYGGSSSSCDLTNNNYLDFQGATGTSASVQVFAGIMALVNQAHGRQGNANYILYPMAASAYTANNSTYCTSNAASVSKTSCIFYDETTGNISVICAGGTTNCSNTSTGQYGTIVTGSPSALAYTAATGYDLATGLGTINAANLVNHWKSSFTATTRTLTLSTTPATNPLTQTHGKAVNFTVHITSGTGTPMGDVSLIPQTNSAGSTVSATTGIGPFTLSSGSVSGSTIMLPGGSYNVVAHYAGDGTHAAGDTNAVAVTVSPEASKTVLSMVTPGAGNTVVYNTGATSLAYGSPYYLRLDVTNSSGNLCAPIQSAGQLELSYPCPTGSVTLTPTSSTVPGQYMLNSQGYAEDQPIQLSPGTYPFVGSYAGDSSYNSSTSAQLPVTVIPAVTAIGLGLSSSSAVAGTSITLTATITTQSYGAAPAGSVQFKDNGTALGSPVLLSGTAYSGSSYAGGQATLIKTFAAGSHSITAQYSGDTNYAASPVSAASPLAITDFSLSANPSPLNITDGQSNTTTISVTPQSGFTGTVNLSVSSGCPTGATCTFASPSLTVSGTAAVTDVLTITTTAGSNLLPGPKPNAPTGHRLPSGWPWVVAGLSGLAALLRLSGTRKRTAAVLLAATLPIAALWLACGGGGGGGGTGPTPAPAVTLSASSLTFTSQNVGTTSAAQAVTLTNSGNAALSISGIAPAGTNPGDFGVSNTCGTSVSAGANCAINVTFAPTATGSRSASVSITDNASTSPQSVGLTGTATPSVPTPKGSYSVVVTAATTTTSHQLPLTVNVQ